MGVFGHPTDIQQKGGHEPGSYGELNQSIIFIVSILDQREMAIIYLYGGSFLGFVIGQHNDTYLVLQWGSMTLFPRTQK